MIRIKNWWLRSSIKRKLLYMSLILMVIMLISEAITMSLSISALYEFESIMDSNSIYHELQDVIKQERESFLSYMRNRTDENRISYEESCVKTQKCIESLPFDYADLGEERYARTWNVVSGYEGYKKYRDRMVNISEDDPDYINHLYEVLDMQESLSNYAIKLVQVTLEQWDIVYDQKMNLLQSVPFLILIVVFIMIVLFMMNWNLLSHTMIKPLVMMAQDSQIMAVTKLVTPPLVVDNKDEIGDLVKAFNTFKKTTEKYIHTLEEKNRISELLHKEELMKMELETRVEQAQLEVLKQQVNPHFLFNTLNMISSMARLEDAAVTDKMIISLSNLFRYNLRTVEQEVYLEQEIAALDDYIYIQQMRFENRIEYEKVIEVDVTSVMIPAFTLQPIVENAFVHGLSSLEEGGKIVVRIEREDDKVIVNISDSGKGMDEKTLENLNKKIHMENTSRRGIGLGNICRRIHMMYQDGSVNIESTEGEGTTVRLVIPQRQMTEEIICTKY